MRVVRLSFALFLVFILIAVLFACGGSGGSGGSTQTGFRAFVTSTSGNADLSSWADAGGNTGLAAADAICQAHAQRGGLTGTFRAWLSDTSDDAYCRMHNLTGKKANNCGESTLPVGAGPWLRMDDFPFAATIEQMVQPTGKIIAPVALDEMGDPIDNIYVTHTYLTGESVDDSAGAACNDFTSASAADQISGGSSTSTGSSATNSTGSICSASWHLLCMQAGTGAPLLPTISASGKKAFVTSATGTGDLSSWPTAGTATGVAAGDAICNSAATAAGLGGVYKAWLSDSATAAADHITSDGPWVRVDGVTIAVSKNDLLDGDLFAPLNVTENGVYLTSFVRAWTGSTESGMAVANRCADWTDASAASSAEVGVVDANGDLWSNWNTFNCDKQFNLYCLED